MSKIRLGPLVDSTLYERLVEMSTRRGLSVGAFVRQLLAFVTTAEEGDRLVLLSESDYIRLAREGERLPPTFMI